jgi:aspartate aminotransferase
MLKDFQTEGTTVLVAPAAGFYQSPGKGIDEIRIAAVLKPEIRRTALTFLIKGLREYQRLNTH